MVYLWCPHCEETTEHDSFGVVGIPAKAVAWRCTECLKSHIYRLEDLPSGPQDIAHQDVKETCPQCGGTVRFWVGEPWGKCLDCNNPVPIIEGGGP